MARQGRQPKSTVTATKSSKKHAKQQQEPSAKKASSSSKRVASTSSAPLDIYSFSSSIKKPRGDVDPASRPSFGSSKAKGKRPEAGEDEEGSDQDSGQDSDQDEGGLDSDGVLEFTGVKPTNLYMGGSDDGEFNSEDDDEIDSDEAYEDEEDLPAKPKKGKGKKTAFEREEVDLDEEELDFDDEEGGAYMDISELLDNGEYATEEDSDDADSGRESEGGSESEVSSDEEMQDEEEEDAEFEGALHKLSSFVEGLEKKKRKAEEETGDGEKKRKRVVLKERTEAYPEGEFVAVTAPEGQESDKVSLDDLLASFAGSKNPRLAALRKTLKPLVAASASPSALPPSRSHLKSVGPLAAPLPGRLQDKIEREAAYEKTKEETDKWNETVRRMKGESGLGVEGARHERLTLPLMGGAGAATRDTSSAEWSAKFQPSNELETSIQTLLSARQMQASDLQRAEKAALAALDPADLAARQAELRQQRDLMFRAERKAKRVAKIKSKAFRRIHRRSKGKEDGAGLSLDDMAELDRIDGGDRVTEEKARMEVVRAHERATLKHSTKGGRWSKTVGDIHGLDEERNTAVRQMVQRGEELRRKIAGADGDESDDGYGQESSEEEDDAADMDRIRKTAFDELASLDARDAEAAAMAPALKGVLNMKFMKDAMARGERKVQTEADELRRKLDLMDDAARQAEDSSGDDEETTALSEQVDGNLGRMVFGPSAGSRSTATSSTILLPIPAQNTIHTTKLTAPLSISSSAASRPSTSHSLLSASLAPEEEANPWLAVGEEHAGGKISRKMNKAIVGKDSRDAARSVARVDRHKAKQADVREDEQNDAQVELDLQVVLAPAKAAKTPQLVAPKKKKQQKVLENSSGNLATAVAKETQDMDDSSEDEDNDEAQQAQRGRGPTAFKQRDLVAKAFAGDNVIADFQAEKRREIERDAPKEEDNTLPGWGTWSGKGVKKAKNAKKFITKIPGIAPSARQDASFNNVIISEKKDKKASKYLLKDLPFPYTSAAQHEHKLRTPLGHEWSTSTIVRDQTLPRVQIKPGVTIRPVDRKV